MGFKTFSVNETFTSGDANSFLVQQQVAIKTADESVTSSTSVQDDNHLSMTLSANTVYWLEGLLIYDAATTGDFRIQFVVPSGLIRWLANGPISGATGTVTEVDRFWKVGSTTTIMGGVGSGTNVVTHVRGIIRVSSSGGTFKLQWAQGTSSATATRVRTNSYIVCTRVIE